MSTADSHSVVASPVGRGRSSSYYIAQKDTTVVSPPLHALYSLRLLSLILMGRKVFVPKIDDRLFGQLKGHGAETE